METVQEIAEMTEETILERELNLLMEMTLRMEHELSTMLTLEE